jgi:hypothetical protein
VYTGALEVDVVPAAGAPVRVPQTPQKPALSGMEEPQLEQNMKASLEREKDTHYIEW